MRRGLRYIDTGSDLGPSPEPTLRLLDSFSDDVAASMLARSVGCCLSSGGPLRFMGEEVRPQDGATPPIPIKDGIESLRWARHRVTPGKAVCATEETIGKRPQGRWRRSFKLERSSNVFLFIKATCSSHAI